MFILIKDSLQKMEKIAGVVSSRENLKNLQRVGALAWYTIPRRHKVSLCQPNPRRHFFP